MEKFAFTGEIPYINLLESLSEESLRTVVRAAQEQLLDKNAIIYDRGAEADRVYIVKKGRVKIFSYDEEGKEVLRNLIHAGKSLGKVPSLAMAAGATMPLPWTSKRFCLKSWPTMPPASYTSVQTLVSRSRCRFPRNYVVPKSASKP